MILLGIETSCDETSIAVVKDGRDVLSNVIASSVKDQEMFGGVVPEIAARRQVEFIMPVLCQALGEAKMTSDTIDAIAVTKGPGLLTSLLVGTSAARVLASVWKKPLIGIHHTLGHLSSTWLDCDDDIKFPLLALSVSGGHTELWYRESHTKGSRVSATRDDAAGEAFDKGAALLGLPYPGGPSISKAAENGSSEVIKFPQPLKGVETNDFSFSGLKTALKYHLRDCGGIDALSESEIADVAASYQDAICLHLVTRVERAIEAHSDITEVHIVGGCSANGRLREIIKERLDVPFRFPTKMAYCTDNAAMIAAAGEFLHREAGDAAFAKFETEASVVLGGQ